MKISVSFKNTIIYVISLIYIFLFMYAAVSKLMDFDNFQIQIAQSPILSAYAKIISWLVPFTEILIAIALIIYPFRLFALYGAFSLMVLFTAYIYIILNYSAFIPCSCGGILEKMTWSEHLLFNVVLIVFAAIGVILFPSNKPLTVR